MLLFVVCCCLLVHFGASWLLFVASHVCSVWLLRGIVCDLLLFLLFASFVVLMLFLVDRGCSLLLRCSLFVVCRCSLFVVVFGCRCWLSCVACCCLKLVCVVRCCVLCVVGCCFLLFIVSCCC